MSKQRVAVVFILIVVAISVAVWLVRNRSISFNASQINNRVLVVTSFYPLYFFAEQIGGDKAQVVNITPAGGEPHDYEPTPQDIVQIAGSELLIMNGGGLETWGNKVSSLINPGHTQVVIAGEDFIGRTRDDAGNIIPGPHVWLSPLLAQKMAEKIKLGYLQIDPTNADYYIANATALESKLGALDADYQQGLKSCVNNNIVTAHDAFGFLAAAYHLSQIPIAGLSPDSEPSPRQLGDIVHKVKTLNIKYIFFESLASPKLSETIARESGVQTLVLNPLEGLTPSDIAAGSDYFTEMQKNLTNLQRACQ